MIVPDGKEKGTYQSSLYNMDSHHLYVSIPKIDRLATVLSAGTKVILDYRDAKDIPCRFETVVDDVPVAEGSHMLVLKCPQIIERHQRRENVRVPVSWPVAILNSSISVPSTMNDLSGGGLSAWIPLHSPLNAGSLVEVRFELNIDKQLIHVNAEAEVISIHKSDEENKGCLCSIKFISLEESLRQRIIEFVFDRLKLDFALRQAGNAIVF
jgi:c-di-GMP-binding flagellar brake protein YcgR